MTESENAQLFDDWPDRYEKWFTAPIGSLVKRVEWELILDLLRPGAGEFILDAGCGTGIFTLDMLSCGARVVGLDLSLSMIRRARQKARNSRLRVISADILNPPFPENTFDKAASITALEFIPDGQEAVKELFRVTRKGGTVVVATLNSLSPWAERRREEGRKGHPLFSKAFFRSPEDLLALGPAEGAIRTAIHFCKEEDPERAARVEEEGQRKGLNTGAFLAARWFKP
ncbi:MAG: class I SAM-dependent methyltransferase [Deltaproteobacteria bacterium]|jgi:ubiquinone/menaquinone biosynthesis C-methylase UbiE|nr:class I SAM-dependent methyltransferase [Deltaproteobacteria bacterium]